MYRNRGFTLLELLIVIAIIAVLVAIAIPVFSDQLARAKAATDMANVRSAEAAATVQFVTDNPDKDTTYYFDAGTGTVTKDASEIKNGYGQSTVAVTNATGVPNVDGKGQIVSVTVRTDGSYSASWVSTGGNAVLDSVVTAAAAAKAANKNISGDSLINAVGTLPSTTASQLCALIGVNSLYSAGGDTELYWRPNTATINGKTEIFLFANVDSTGHANWQGYAVYYNGSYYKSTNINKYSGSTDRAGVGSFSTFIETGTGPWQKVG